VIKDNLFTLCIGCVLLLALGVVANRCIRTAWLQQLRLEWVSLNARAPFENRL